MENISKHYIPGDLSAVAEGSLSFIKIIIQLLGVNLADEFVADAEEDDTSLAALAADASDVEVFSEEAYADVVVEVEAEEEVLIEEIFGLQHGAYACAEVEGTALLLLAAVGHRGSADCGFVALTGDAEEGVEVEAGGGLQFDVVAYPVG